MAYCKHFLTIWLLVLQGSCSSITGASRFKNHTTSSVASSTATNKEGTSASSAAALQYNRTLTNDSHRTESSEQSGSVSAMATAMNLKGNASSLSETAAQRNDQIIKGDDNWTASIKHAISQSTTHILKGREKGMVSGIYPEIPSAMTFCEYPAKCLSGALASTSSKPLKTVVIADAQRPSQVQRKWRPPSSRLWVYCLDPDSCEQEYGFRSYGDINEYYDSGDQTIPLREQANGFVVRGRDLSRAIERRDLTQEFHNILQQLNSSSYYRWINFPTKELLAKILTLSTDERLGNVMKCLVQKLTDHIEGTYGLEGKMMTLKMLQNRN